MKIEIPDIHGAGHEIDFENFQSVFLNCDCMDALRRMPDDSIELAIVDPVYGDVTQGGYMKNYDSTKKLARPTQYHLALWNQKKTEKDYFDEVRRVSVNQIIWGGNYFSSMLPDSQCWIVWDKQRTGGFADFEIAWTSFNRASRMFRFMWNGMIQQDMKNKEFRIHPTQKPVALYEWLLENFAKDGDKILDTHAGSASSLVACHHTGHKFLGFEIDEEYYKKAKARLDAEMAQGTIFDFIKT